VVGAHPADESETPGDAQRVEHVAQLEHLARVGAGADPVVLTALERWRAAAARAAGVPRHVVLHDTTLAAVAEAQPRDLDGLLALPGLGPVKVDRYGGDLLTLVAEHLAS